VVGMSGRLLTLTAATFGFNGHARTKLRHRPNGHRSIAERGQGRVAIRRVWRMLCFTLQSPTLIVFLPRMERPRRHRLL
jgi:hypothetical protein